MHSFVSCLLHVVFSTKERRRVITPSLRAQLWPYLAGIARNNKMKAVKIGGVEDHVHILLSLQLTLDIAKAGKKAMPRGQQTVIDQRVGVARK